LVTDAGRDLVAIVVVPRVSSLDSSSFLLDDVLVAWGVLVLSEALVLDATVVPDVEDRWRVETRGVTTGVVVDAVLPLCDLRFVVTGTSSSELETTLTRFRVIEEAEG